MPLIYSAILPHPPLLVPSIGKKAVDLLKVTSDSYRKIEEDLYAADPDAIIVISPHGAILEKAFSINLAPVFTASFEEFGDFGTKKTFTGNIGLSHRIRESLETQTPLQLITSEKIDYGTAIPLMSATGKLAKTSVIPMHISGLSTQEHFDFGKVLQKHLMMSQDRIAVIASADLSHALTKKSPAPYSSKGKKFDKKITDLLSEGRFEEVAAIDRGLAEEACECGLKPIALLLGAISGVNLRPQMLSYEAPFGVGYLVMRFVP
jgi:aromatic ring-opening dioxygenase LigB subunit